MNHLFTLQTRYLMNLITSLYTKHMTIFHSLVLGIVQGISEFLPISSSGHLVVIPYLFGWQPHSLSFDVALHFGTVIALAIFFWNDWMEIIKNGFKYLTNRDFEPTSKNYPKDILWQILVATIPAAVVGLILDKYVESYFHQPLLLALNFAFFGWLLWYVDKKYAKNQDPGKLTYKKSFWIGFAQSIALIPGVSRSGITMTAARMNGLNRENAARFSFLIGTPAMIGAFLLKFKDIAANDLNLTFLVGVVASAIFGIISIKFLLDYLKKSDFSVFLWYRVALAIIIVAVYFLR